MARKVMGAGSSDEAEETVVPSVPPPPAPKVEAKKEPAKSAEEAVLAKKFRVMNGGFIVMHGARSFMKPGKIVEDTCYDLDLLRSQGIVLEPIG